MPESAFEFIVLGSGTSAGVPAIGCDCATCCSDDPRDVRTRTSAAACFTDSTGQERVLLLDTSPDLRQQVLREGIRRCDGIFYTHHHVDHLFGLDEVRRFNAVMKEPIPIHAESRSMEHVRRVHPHIFESERNANPSFVATLLPHLLQPGDPVEFHGLKITPFRVDHGRLPILGFRLDHLETPPADSILPLAWCTDASSIPPESLGLLDGVRTLFLDMLRHRHHPTHMTVDQAVAMASEIGAGQTWFIHMAHEISHAEVDASLPEGMRLAWDGLRLGAGPRK